MKTPNRDLVGVSTEGVFMSDTDVHARIEMITLHNAINARLLELSDYATQSLSKHDHVSKTACGLLDPPKAAVSVGPPQGPYYPGDQVTLRCDIGGTSQASWETYNWYKNNDNIPDETIQTITNSLPNNAGVYQFKCQGRSENRPNNSLISDPLSITVKALPTAEVVVVFPQSPFYPGEKVTLTCDVAGYQDRSHYIWYNGNNQIHNKNNKTITISLPNEAGQYTSLPTAEVVVVSPRSPFYPGDTVTLRCAIAGYQDRSHYRWYNSNNVIPNKNSETISISLPNEAGQYTCDGRISDRQIYSHQSGPATISTTALPTAEVIVSPQSPYYSGETVTLRCAIAEYQDRSQFTRWYKDNNLISNRNSKTITISLPNEAGQYTCDGRISDRPTYSLRSGPATISTTALPTAEVIVSPQSPYYSGETVTLRCAIAGYQDRSQFTRWYKDNNLMNRKNRKTITISLPSEAGQYTSFPAAEVVILSPQSPYYPGETVTLGCDIAEHQDWSQYIWYKGDNQVPNKNSKTITISLPNDAGQYTCEGHRKKRPLQSQQSGSSTISATALPTATVSVVSPQGPYYPGDQVTLRCDIAEHTDWDKYYWYRDSSYIDLVRYQSSSISLPDQIGQHQFTCEGRRSSRPHKSQHSKPTSVTVTDLPTPTVSVKPEGPVFTGETVTMTCVIESLGGWTYQWYKGSSRVPVSEGNTFTITSAAESDEGQYWCQGKRRQRPKTSQRSSSITLDVKESKPQLTFTKSQLFTGDSVTLTCKLGIRSGLEFYWYKDTQTNTPVAQTFLNSYSISSAKLSDGGQYWCRAGRGYPVYYTQYSNEVLLNVTEMAKAVVSVSSQSWLNEGNSVKLSCKVEKSSAGWRFKWFKITLYNLETNYQWNQLLPDSSTGAGGSYTLRPAALRHTGVYVCRAERGEPAFQTEFSQPQPLWVTGSSPDASVINHSNWTQIFTYEPLSLSCGAQGKSTGWSLMRFTGRGGGSRCPPGWRQETGSTCSTSSASTSDSGVYWCQSESGEQSNAVNTTVHDGDVILESPVHPVTEGDPLTLRCRYRNQPSNISADFYKDGTLLHTSSTGEMTIPAVSKSHEGLYKCSNPERGESPESWITVMPKMTGSYSGSSISTVAVGVLVGLVIASALVILLVLLYHKRKSKGKKNE
ncbi:Fc receptor-like protein 3 [Engraulis encrasicolus]|uniref:Fc receptor-like protein 3 n=1 Tax=Engraulis encrasicolus TaxID=184585 RepID=UPI002FD052C5